MNLKAIVVAVTMFVLIPFTADSGFSFKGAWNSVSSLPGKVGKAIVGGSGIGGAVEGAFEPAINRLEEANRRSINLLDEKLSERLNQFNGIMEAREEQLDEIFKSSIYLMDESLKEDINKIDESLKVRIGQLNSGLSTVSYNFSSALWTVFRGIATISLVFFLLFLIQNFIAEYRSNKKNNLKEENRKLTTRFFVRLGITLLGFIFTLFFEPSIFKHFRDPALTKQIEAIKENLKTSASSLNYDECIYYSSILTSYEIENPEYQYYLTKYMILRDFLYRPKLTLFSLNNIQELQSKFTLLEKYKFNAEQVNPKFKDFEYQVINALFFSNVMNNKEGDLIAAYLSYTALQDSTDSPLKPLAVNMINTYLFHPINDEDAKKLLVEDSFLAKDNSLPNFSSFSSYDCNSINGSLLCSNYNYNSIIKKLQEGDEQDFYLFLNAPSQNSKEEIGIRMVKRWQNALNKIDGLSSLASNIISKALVLDDSYVNYVIISTPTNIPRYTEILADINNETANLVATIFPNNIPVASPSITQTSYQTSLNSFNQLSSIRKFLLSKFLSQFSFLSRMPYLSMAINDFAVKTTAMTNLITYRTNYERVKAHLATTTPADVFIAYANYIKSLSEFDIYNYEPNSREPLASDILNELPAATNISNDNAIKKSFEHLNEMVNTSLRRKTSQFL